MKRYSLLSLFLLTLILPAFAFTDSEYPNLEFTVLDAEAKTVSVKAVDKTLYTAESILNIPSLVSNGGEEYTVVKVDRLGFNAIKIAHISLPSTIQVVDSGAFRNIKTSFTIELNEGLREIGNRAFCQSTGMKGNLKLPASLKTIYSQAALLNISVDTIICLSETPPSFTSSEKIYTMPVVPLCVPCGSGMTYINDKCWGALDVIDPCSVFTIDGLSYMPIGNDKVKLTTYDKAKTLPSALTIPDKVTNGTSDYIVSRIAHNAFKGNEDLASVSMPAQLVTIGKCAFMGCKNLKKVVFNEGLETIEDTCFMSTIIDTLQTPTTLISIGQYSFRSNKSMKKIILNEGLQIIGNRAFTSNTNIGDSIVIPSTVTQIGPAVFTSCAKIKTVILKGTTPPQVKNDTYEVFGSASTYIIPCGSMELYKSADYWKDLSGQFVSTCKPLVIHDGEALTNDTIVSEIQYVRVFNDD
ncbi:MAG: leucine-rich repeat protein, partial [Paludibacteraceae bacterium]